MQRSLRFAITAAVLASWALPAQAQDDVATVCRKLAAAAAGVTSFVVQIEAAGTSGVNGSLTFVRPMKVKSELGIGGLSLESYLIDGTQYVHGTDGWSKMKVDPAQLPQQSANVAEGLKPSNVTLLPDRQENGSALGVFAVDAALPERTAPARVVCTFDKVSYRLSVCTSDGMTMTYTHYNDPANAVVLPPEAKADAR